jgi:hypothetical protein
MRSDHDAVRDLLGAVPRPEAAELDERPVGAGSRVRSATRVVVLFVFVVAVVIAPVALVTVPTLVAGVLTMARRLGVRCLVDGASVLPELLPLVAQRPRSQERKVRIVIVKQRDLVERLRRPNAD